MYLPLESITAYNFDLLKDKMSNMDLIFFRGDDVVSDTIAELQDVKNKISVDTFTHVGIVIKPELLPGYNLDSSKLYILESTYSHEISGMNNGPIDCLTGEKFFGVQLRDLESVCKSYIRNNKTKIGWAKLIKNIDIKDFVSIFKKYHLRPFLGKDMLSVFDPKVITPEMLANTKSKINKMWIKMILKSSFSCVNLVTCIYDDLGLISGFENITYPMELLNLTPRHTNFRRVVYSDDL